MAKRRVAARRMDPHVSADCRCPVCIESAQLHTTATWHPSIQVRAVAMLMLGAMESVRAGRIGGVAVEQLFD